MTQTANQDQGSAARRGRPGQRQQERLMRNVRRRRRRQIIFSCITALVLVSAAILGILQYQRYSADQAAAATKLQSQHAAATAGVKNKQASATAVVVNQQAAATAAVQATQVAKILGPLPKAGPDKPPAVSGTPVKLPDGLQYIDIKTGIGPAAQKGSKVTVQYTGWLADTNKKFDSSFDRGGQPFTVTVGNGEVIKGWDEGLVGIQAGGTRRLIIPAPLGYDVQGQPPVIPPNAVLIFDVTAVNVA